MMNRGVMQRQMFAAGGAAFPDLTGDGRVTQADILKGRGVEFKQEGGIAGMMPPEMDAVPGTITYYWFEPNKNGEYEVLCAEYCGVAHYAMRGKVVVEDEENYNKWLAERETFSSFIAKNKSNQFKEKKLVKINNVSSKENSILRKQNVR